MITITRLSIANDLKTMYLDVNVAAGQTVTSLTLWTSATFKDEDTKKDLTSKLSGTGNTESIELVPADINEAAFSDLYFLQIESSDSGDNPALAAAINLSQFYGTVAGLLYSVDTSCLNCNANLQNAILIDMYIEAIKTSLQVGRFRDAITFFEKINIVTKSSECTTCNQSTVNSSGDGWVSVGVIDCVLIEGGANVG